MSVARAAARHPRGRSNHDVLVAYTRPDGLIDGVGADCRTQLALYDGNHHQRIREMNAAVGGPRIAELRNGIVHYFLGTDMQRLFMIDADMTFAPEVLDEMLERQDGADIGIVAGLCFTGGDGKPTHPTIFTLNPDPFEGDDSCACHARRPAWDLHTSYPKEDRLINVDGTGAAALLIRRDVLEKIQAAWEWQSYYPWFEETQLRPCQLCGFRGESIGEDLTFCLRARTLGIEIAIDLGAKFGHRKPITLDEQLFVAQHTR